MRQDSPSHRMIGYLVASRRVSNLTCVGTALINGDTIEHELTLGARPQHTIDVGRNGDGDLVWASAKSSGGELKSSLLSLNSFVHNIESNHEDESDTEVELELPRKGLVSFVRKRQRTLMFALGVVAVIVLCGVSIPRGTSTTVAGETSTVHPATNDVEPEPHHDPAAAAINFVLAGQVAGITVPEGANPDDFTATVVSQSGEIVLVDVQLNSENGLTTFATLLLQKSGTAWRIREVFDPR